MKMLLRNPGKMSEMVLSFYIFKWFWIITCSCWILLRIQEEDYVIKFFIFLKGYRHGRMGLPLGLMGKLFCLGMGVIKEIRE